MAEVNWPLELGICWHGQSASNVALDAAELAGTHAIDIHTSDADTRLSEFGERQSEALGLWFRQLPSERAPAAVFTTCHSNRGHRR